MDVEERKRTEDIEITRKIAIHEKIAFRELAHIWNLLLRLNEEGLRALELKRFIKNLLRFVFWRCNGRACAKARDECWTAQEMKAPCSLLK